MTPVPLQQVMGLPEPLARNLALLQEQGRVAEEADLLDNVWLSSRMVVMYLAASALLLADAMKRPVLMRTLAPCANAEVLSWLLEAAVSVGTGEFPLQSD
jgi:hypothetical protein